MPDIIHYEDGISALDSRLGRRRLTSIHIIVEEGHAAMVDTGGSRSVPVVLEALEALGVARENVDYVMLTHVHLDHAGGAGALMRELPNARLTVHPRGVRHIVNPTQLIAGTIDVYGAEHMNVVYGDIVPVPAERVIEATHESHVSLAGRSFVFLDSPGHARHHVCIRDEKSRSVFTGDTFGLAYSELDLPPARYIFPTTSPTQFDPEAAHRSVDMIAGLDPPCVYLAHYAQVRDVQGRATDLHRLIDAHAGLARKERDSPDRHGRLVAGIEKLVIEEAERRGWHARRDDVLEIMRDDIELNALGLACWLDAMP